MKRSPLNKVGKIGKRNIDANKILKYIYNDYGITRCELCGTDNMLSFAHKEKREWYRKEDRIPLLSSFQHTLLLCIPCHETIEYDKELTKKTFAELRPTKNYKSYID